MTIKFTNLKKLLKPTLLVGGLFTGTSIHAQVFTHSDTLQYTGSMQTYTVPDCAENVVITTYGAQGAAGSVLVPDINEGGKAGLGNRWKG